MTTRIYAASLSDYDNGNLHGTWIDLADCSFDPDAVLEAIQAMLATSKEPGAEEFAIHDFEGFGGFKLAEYEPIAEVCKIAELISNNDDDAAKVLHAYDATNDVDTVQDYIDDNYQGEYKDKGEFAYQLAEDLGDLKAIPDFIKHHIDWDSVARDLFMGDYDYCDSDNGIHVFRVS